MRIIILTKKHIFCSEIWMNIDGFLTYWSLTLIKLWIDTPWYEESTLKMFEDEFISIYLECLSTYNMGSFPKRIVFLFIFINVDNYPQNGICFVRNYYTWMKHAAFVMTPQNRFSMCSSSVSWVLGFGVRYVRRCRQEWRNGLVLETFGNGC